MHFIIQFWKSHSFENYSLFVKKIIKEHQKQNQNWLNFQQNQHPQVTTVVRNRFQCWQSQKEVQDLFFDSKLKKKGIITIENFELPQHSRIILNSSIYSCVISTTFSNDHIVIGIFFRSIKENPNRKDFFQLFVWDKFFFLF